MEEDSDKYTGPVQRGSATHVSHRDGAVTVLLELVHHVTHNLCTRDVRAKMELHVCSRACQAAQKKEVFKDLNLSITSSKSSRDQNATLKTPVTRRLHHRRQKYSKPSCFNVRIQRARKEDHKTKSATLLDEGRHGFAQRFVFKGLNLSMYEATESVLKPPVVQLARRVRGRKLRQVHCSRTERICGTSCLPQSVNMRELCATHRHENPSCFSRS